MSIADTSATVPSAVHRQVVGLFAAGWRQPDPHAWDELLADDVDLHQPLMADGVGRVHWQQEFARLQAFLPDLRGEIAGWAASDDTIYVDVHCVATAGGLPLQFRALDRLTVTPDGTVTRRDSFFDPTPLVRALLMRPAAWAAWWRSGVAPFAGRRTLVGRHAINGGDEPARTTTPAGRTELRRPRPLWLGVIRGCVGVTTLARPRLAYRCLGSHGEPSAGGFLARAFGARELAIALATLSSDPRTARVGVRLGMVADAADVASILLGRRRRGLPAGAALVIGGAAALFATAGAAVLADGDIIEHRGRRREDRLQRPRQETERS
ncbi:hypothetical protein GCM10010464_12190 [Pseudonocardia yunnanensis]|uniref:Nuclear transport factor 2 family protein n=1 Tax=Pseudonocardia yunnanensis TaxID=58107 RepID=A0ABW4FB09_9PSEU